MSFIYLFLIEYSPNSNIIKTQTRDVNNISFYRKIIPIVIITKPCHYRKEYCLTNKRNIINLRYLYVKY